MTLPTLINDSEATDALWQRKVRDVVNGLVRRTSGMGATTERPKAPAIGQQFYDKTLGIPIWWNGSAWKNAAGTTV